EIGFF
ncbi:hypothetical protein CPC698_1622B, partial [Chlamydia psittaci C6/98]